METLPHASNTAVYSAQWSSAQGPASEMNDQQTKHRELLFITVHGSQLFQSQTPLNCDYPFRHLSLSIVIPSARPERQIFEGESLGLRAFLSPA